MKKWTIRQESDMRKTCLECVAKHLGSAAVYIEETMMGYPNYYGFAYGELAHASSECMADHPELARVIREHRIQWGESRTRDDPHRIPFEALFAYIQDLEQAGEALGIPAEAREGLRQDEDGNVLYSMDTRP